MEIVTAVAPSARARAASETVRWSIRERYRQAQTLVAFAQTHPGPLLYPGDSNTTDQNDAYRMLATKAGLRADEWLLVWGIGSGVSTACLAIAKALGAHVIVTSGSAQKLDRARELGADAALNHAEDDVPAAVKELTGGGAHVVVDHVGQATWQRSLAAARVDGRVCVCGATSGPNPPAQLHRIWWKQLTVYGSTMGSREDFEAVYDLVTKGRAVPVIDHVFPLAEAARAHERLEAGEQLGKIVLKIPG